MKGFAGEKYITAQSATSSDQTNRATVRFALSLVSGSIGFLLAFSLLGWAANYRPSGSYWGNFFTPNSWVNSPLPGAKQNTVIFAAIATVSAIIVILGAILIYTPGKETVGGVLAIVFSVIGLTSLGFPIAIYNIIGIAGGAVGLAKK